MRGCGQSITAPFCFFFLLTSPLPCSRGLSHGLQSLRLNLLQCGIFMGHSFFRKFLHIHPPTACRVNICLFQQDFSNGCRETSAPASEALPPHLLISFFFFLFATFVCCVLPFLNQVFLETPPALLYPRSP